MENHPKVTREQVKTTWLDVLKALKMILVDPVGGLPKAFETLGKRPALLAGIFLAVVFDVLVFLGVTLSVSKWSRPGVSGYLRLILMGFVLVASVAVASLLIRLVFRGRGCIEGDVFIAGWAALPFGIVMLFTGILGMGNAEIILILSALGACYTILILYGGCTGISQIGKKLAAPAVSIILVVGGWLSKIILTSLA